MAGFDTGKAAAGLRGAYWDPDRLPADVRLTVHALRTGDDQVVSGYLLARGGERTVCVLMHPREHLVANYLAAELLVQGLAVFIQAPRLVGNDIRLEHEIALYDAAAAIIFLRSRGYEKVVTVGNSGGGPLWAFYNQQALAAPDHRIALTPGGRPTNLNRADLPPADALVFVSSHLGQGHLLLQGIDPSLTDEANALSVEPELDPFRAANGYAFGGATYAADFIERYRQAQIARIQRLAAIARDHIAERTAARRRLKAGDADAAVLAAFTPIFPVWRTDADLRCWDLSLDPSDRRFGSLWGSNPAVSNYGSIAFGRICTAESWLSTWSGLSSNAAMERCAPAIEQPTLMVEYTGDSATFPADNDALFGWIGSARKERVSFKGDHHGRPIWDGDPEIRPEVGKVVAGWINDNL